VSARASADLHAPEPWLTWRLLQSGAASRPEALAHQALRTRSPAALGALASAATAGAETPESLLHRLLDDGPDGLLTSPLRVRALASTAMVWAGSLRSTEELTAAALLLEHLWQDPATADLLPPELHLVTGQTLFLAGRHAALEELLPRLTHLPEDAAHYLRADLANPFVRHPHGSGADWPSLLGQYFVQHDLAAVRLGPEVDGLPPFDRLEAPGPVPGSVGGELVTVVMPCYRPDRGLLTSVRSIISQTWADLEIVIVDDASGPEHADLFAEAAALDPRARVLTMPRNGGSYLGREAAIAQSRGSLVTFQDADDWSHPRRIEHQVAVLHERSAPMSRSMAVRAKDDLTHQWLGYPPVRLNASSLLVRRSVLDRCGGFVPVRKGADSEFAERIRVLAGPVADTWTPLAVTRLRSGSLSRGDFTLSWFAPDRLTFRGSFMAWHRRLRERVEAGEEVSVSTEELHALPFPVPPGWVRDLDGSASTPTVFEQVYLGHFSTVRPSRAVRALQDHLAEQPPLSGSVGVWHHEAPWVTDRRRPRMSHGWLDVAHAHPALRAVSRADRVHARRVVVVDPSVLALMTGQHVEVQADEVDVWLTPQVVDPDASLLPEDLLGIADVVAAWWGVRPRWVLAPHLDPQERAHVRASLPHLRVEDPDEVWGVSGAGSAPADVPAG
jgi:hypothetical protein